MHRSWYVPSPSALPISAMPKLTLIDTPSQALLIPAHIRALLLVSTSLSSLSSYPPFIRLPSLSATSLIIRQTLGLIKTPEEQVAGIVECLFPKAYLAQKAEGEGEGEGEARTNREVKNEEFLKRYNFGKRQTPVGRAGQTAAVMCVLPPSIHSLVFSSFRSHACFPSQP